MLHPRHTWPICRAKRIRRRAGQSPINQEAIGQAVDGVRDPFNSPADPIAKYPLTGRTSPDGRQTIPEIRTIVALIRPDCIVRTDELIAVEGDDVRNLLRHSSGMALQFNSSGER